MSLRSKLDRAIVARLRDQGVCTNIYPANSSDVREFPNVTVWSHAGTQDPAFTGTYRFRVDIHVQYQAAVQQEEVNPEANRVALDALTDSVYAALMESDNGYDLQATAGLITASGNALAAAADTTDEAILRAANNADMAEFTCQQWLEAGLDGGIPDDGSTSWREILQFDAVAAGKANLL